ncbi:ABATE domain-containing protein [Thermocatellispora tengchongensis]|uniref:ABATE domain-containing protein n=1 Tax=Thermocatellispora tengchongensis TaxID=1073253 RepID=UPI00363DB746
MNGAAELVRDFVNTYDVEAGTDELSSPAELVVWLRGRGLAGARDRADAGDLALAVGLREGLRAALRHNHDRAAPHPLARPFPPSCHGWPRSWPRCRCGWS